MMISHRKCSVASGNGVRANEKTLTDQLPHQYQQTDGKKPIRNFHTKQAGNVPCLTYHGIPRLRCCETGGSVITSSHKPSPRPAGEEGQLNAERHAERATEGQTIVLLVGISVTGV